MDYLGFPVLTVNAQEIRLNLTKENLGDGSIDNSVVSNSAAKVSCTLESSKDGKDPSMDNILGTS